MKLDTLLDKLVEALNHVLSHNQNSCWWYFHWFGRWCGCNLNNLVSFHQETNRHKDREGC